MTPSKLIMSLAALGMLACPALAQDQPPTPPADAVKLSQIVAEVEARQDFRYIDQIDWDNDGYLVTYYTSDKAKVEIKFDPTSGKPK